MMLSVLMLNLENNKIKILDYGLNDFRLIMILHKISTLYGSSHYSLN